MLIASLAGAATGLMPVFETLCQNTEKIGELLWQECAPVALWLFPHALTIKFIIDGLMCMMLQKRWEDTIFRATISVIFFSLLVVTAFPQKVFVSFLNPSKIEGQTAAGVGLAIGQEVASLGGTKAEGKMPYEWWLNWLDKGGSSGGTKLDFKYALEEVAGIKNLKVMGKDLPPWDASFKQLEDAIEKFIKDQSYIGDIAKAIFSPSSLMAVLIIASVGMSLLGAYVAVLSIFIGILVFLMFAMLGMPIGILLAFYMCMAFGAIVMALICFEKYKDLWVPYLEFLLSMVLAVFFFYLLNGVGYAIGTGVFDALFGEGKPGTKLVLAGYDTFIANTTAQPGKLVTTLVAKLSGSLGDVAPLIIGFVIAAPVWIATATLVATVITGSVGLSLIATAYGVAWTRAFAVDQIIGETAKIIEGLKQPFLSGISSVGTAVTGMVAQQGQQLGKMAGGAASLLGNLAKGVANRVGRR